MSYTVIESADKALLDAFRDSAEFAYEFAAHQPIVTQGMTDNAGFGDQGPCDAPYWLLVEDALEVDNTTFRLDKDGLHYWATGVEV